MPQFQLNKPSRNRKAYDNLSEFAKGYIEAMFFTNCDSGDDNEHLANELGVERLTNASIVAIKRDCDKFLNMIMPDGCFVRQWLDRVDDYSDEQVGHDLWFTRQGHGVGFWSRKELESEARNLWLELGSPRVGEPGWNEYASARETSPGNALSEVARKMGETYVEIYRGWIHHR